MRHRSPRRRSPRALVAALGLATVGVSGCGDWLKVTNPGAIEPPALEDSVYIGLMVNGVIGDFQPAFAWTALFSGAFTDELRNHHGFFENGEIDRRAVGELNGTYLAAVYNGLHRARFMGDSVAGRLKALRGAAAASDLRLARVLAYAGYAWVLLGEQMCETPINRSAPVPWDQLLDSALARFDEAIAVAGAAKTAAVLRADSLGADSIANFARVGAARAALHKNDGPRAAAYAAAVTPAYGSEASKGFEFRAHYRDGATSAERRRYGNPFWEFMNAERWFSASGTPFDALNRTDPRVPGELRTTADGTTRLTPNSPQAFSTYNAALRNTDGSFAGGRFAATSTMRVASALEARYVIAEVEGLTPANLAFVNDRRAVGGDTALAATITPAEYLAALRDQRRRDFFLDGHRMGDLRRYKRYYGIDEWPSGPYFGSTTVSYGTQECWPIPATER
ncbi:MAG TPA: hypothetical protein VNI61_09255 [Gemmatimonadales bacterium]|nr:hypothetical protein [Gemmatimonadales bacterium]